MTSHGYKQNEIPQELSIGTKIFKTSYYTCLLDVTLSVYHTLLGAAAAVRRCNQSGISLLDIVK
jgi:hypothetical protein